VDAAVTSCGALLVCASVMSRAARSVWTYCVDLLQTTGMVSAGICGCVWRSLGVSDNRCKAAAYRPADRPTNNGAHAVDIKGEMEQSVLAAMLGGVGRGAFGFGFATRLWCRWKT